MKDTVLALLIGWGLDILIGDPEWFPHPVRFIGRFIGLMENRLRKSARNLRAAAPVLTLSTVSLTMAATGGIVWLLNRMGRLPYMLGCALIFWTGLSTKCLAREAEGVRRALGLSLNEGRKRVARIVGRETAHLTEKEIICATVETVAENTTDGVIAPMLYALLGGPVLMMGFKAASTLDSMVGYMDDRYRDIGWFSARLDDVLNFVPARLTALLMVVSAFLFKKDGKAAFRTVLRDHDKHKSPNCAWSEAAAAGALHIQLGGTHVYHGESVFKPTIGDNIREPLRSDIADACKLMYATSSLAALLLLILP